MPKIDLTNQTFGRLTVIEERGKDKNGKIMWLCKCICGNQKIVRGNDLRSGRTQSCGCLNKEKVKEAGKKRAQIKAQNPSFKKDLSNQRFGRLVVLEFDIETTIQKRTELNNKYSYWKCQCDCGNIISVCSTSLTSGHTQSCGCLQKEKASIAIKKIQPLSAKNRLCDLTGQYFDNILVLRRYKDNTNYNKPQWVCQCHCGNIFITNGQSLKSGSVKSCGCIGKSIGEYKIQDLLVKNNISFSKEIKFSDLKDKAYLRFDFAILDDKGQIIKLIEFDGRQHTDKSSFWYNETLVKHDQLKNEYCKNNNIPLLRISYLDLDKIDIDYLLNKITQI